MDKIHSPAGLLRRLAALFYDTLVLACVLFVSTLIVVMLNGGQAFTPHDPVLSSILLLTSFVFTGWFWTHGGQTLGMKAWRIKVQGKNGETLTWKTSAIRYSIALVSLSCLGLGYFWILFDGQRRSWHDRVSGTCVVRL